MSILDAVNVLIETKLADIGRAANMTWLIFENKKGVEYSLHVQCPWRFENDKGILVSSGDMYEPATSFCDDYDNFDWDIYGNNLYDEKALLMKNKYYVKECIAGRYGDLEIRLTENIKFITFSNNSFETEQWRFFEWDGYKTKEELEAAYENNTNKKHLVVTSLGYEIG